jgi:hypothetical protein
VSQPTRWRHEEAKVASEVARRAIRRLDVLEWVMLMAAGALAVGGGALVSLLLVGRAGQGFRVVWIATSLLLMIVPGVLVLAPGRRKKEKPTLEGSSPEGAPHVERDRDGGR